MNIEGVAELYIRAHEAHEQTRKAEESAHEAMAIAGGILYQSCKSTGETENTITVTLYGTKYVINFSENGMTHELIKPKLNIIRKAHGN